MKIKYIDPPKWNAKTKKYLDAVTAVCEEYRAQGYRLTLRQLYYQLVSKDLIPNRQQEYKRLSEFLKQTRMAGVVDWDIIEDRNRRPQRSSHWDSIQDIVESAVASFRLPRWEDQDEFVEIWVEKDALSGVLSPIADEYHVSLMVNRGYSSATAMHDAARRLRNYGDEGDNVTILYLGDHDPSGEDMVRDIEDRLRVFKCQATVKKVALTMEQIRKYNPPPNPVKFQDVRAAGYEAKHGDKCWELDALKPDVLHKLLHKEIKKIIDMDKYNAVIEREQTNIARLREVTADI
jgi:hypothetical protein